MFGFSFVGSNRGRRPVSVVGPLAPFDPQSPSVVCHFCGARRWALESAAWCCRAGTISTRLRDLPPDLLRLFKDRDFAQHSRALQNLFAFSSLGVSGNVLPLGRPAAYTISGRTYHVIGLEMQDLDQVANPKPSTFLR